MERTCEERKLLHWVNSLPPPACLLVEALADLRFGDVLLAIVHWLRLLQATQTLSSDSNRIRNDELLASGCDASVLRLRRVLLVVAREARSEDGDALFVVNEAQCAERIRGGALDAICAVLRVLKRTSDQLRAQRQEQEQQGSPEQLRDHAAITTELLRLNTQHESVTLKSAGGQEKRKCDLRIVGLSSDRFREAVDGDSRIQVPMETHELVKSQHNTVVTTNSSTCGNAAGVGLKKQAVRRPKATKNRQIPKTAADEEPKIPIYRDSKGQLHVYSMVDPTPHKRSFVARKSALVNTTASEAALRVHAWMDALGVVLQRKHYLLAPKQPVESPRISFQDGVVLCQIAARVAKKYGDEAQKRRLKTFVDQSSNRVVLLPREATLSPQNATLKRKNVTIAVEILTKFCGMQHGGRSDGVGDGGNSVVAKLIAFFTADRRQYQDRSADDSVYELLDHVRAGIEASKDRFATTAASAPLKVTNKGLANGDTSEGVGVDENSRLGVNAHSVGAPTANSIVHQGEKRRPYITSEQMYAVNRWLKSIDENMMESSGKSLLQDPLRNGMLFCKLYAQALARPQDIPLRFAKAPKTLTEVRQNLAKVFERVSQLENLRLHPHYLSSSTWEAVIMGDRQVTYGILWHLWQFVQEREHRNRKERIASLPVVRENNPHSQEVEPHESVASVNLSKPETKFSAEKKAVEKQKSSAKVCPILIDIPAAVLASEKHSSKKIRLGFDSRGPFESPDLRSFWEDDHLLEYDLYPQLSAATDTTCLTEIKADGPLVEQQELADVAEEGVCQMDITSCSTLVSSQDVSLVMEDSVAEPALKSLQSQDERTDTTLDGVSPIQPATDDDDDGKLCSFARMSVQGSHFCALPCVEQSELIVEASEGDDTPVIQQGIKLVCSSEQPNFPDESMRELLAWLKRLKIRISNPAAFQTPSARLMEFQSGVLLCSIVERVEYMRCIQGVCRKTSLTKANALHNISKALEILQQRKTMPLHLLRRKHEIYNGDRRVILELLRQIRKAYGHHYYLQSNSVVKPPRTGALAIKSQRTKLEPPDTEPLGTISST